MPFAASRITHGVPRIASAGEETTGSGDIGVGQCIVNTGDLPALKTFSGYVVE